MSIRRGKEKTQTVTRRLFLFLALGVVLLDQLSKMLVQAYLFPGVSHPVIPPFFQLTLVQNEGVAFGLLQGFEKILRFIIPLSIAVLVVIGPRFNPAHFKTQWAIGLILGGALGNWIDPIRVGAVIDSLDFRIWPVFNLADTAISVGVGLFMLEFLKSSSKQNVS